MLTMVTEVFGVSGGYGNLSIQPKLLASQFDADGRACINLPFAGKLLRISFVNRTRHESAAMESLPNPAGAAPLQTANAWAFPVSCRNRKISMIHHIK